MVPKVNIVRAFSASPYANVIIYNSSYNPIVMRRLLVLNPIPFSSFKNNLKLIRIPERSFLVSVLTVMKTARYIICVPEMFIFSPTFFLVSEKLKEDSAALKITNILP